MRNRPTNRPNGQRKLRCAIYTRKSNEEGLEQDFNSLDAQREACEAFIASQRHEGWSVLPEMYDDGGFSGGTMERPAFQRLLADVADGKVDVVVVYKVDRLTRSLSDFARIVEVFDKRSVSFVSVTQQFNTTSSMGRLTLNILLSFAQFEREVTGERIRDKIAASKKKGMWMGGQPPLGYDVKDRKLVVNEAEAETVRHIFQRYAALQSVRLLKADLDAAGIVSKTRLGSDGSRYGAKPIARGALYLMLQNRIYRGEIVHKDQSYPGEHAAIVEESLWEQVQAILTTNRIERTNGENDREPSPLAGLLYDARGERMTPTHATKNGTRYRYYVSRTLLTGGGRDAVRGQRIPAAALEAVVSRRLRALLSDPAVMHGVLADELEHTPAQDALVERAKDCAANWETLRRPELRAALLSIVAKVRVNVESIDIVVDRRALARWLGGASEDAASSKRNQDHHLTLTIPVQLRRAGKEMRLVYQDGSGVSSPDSRLVRLLVRAHAIRDRLLNDKSITLEELAKAEGVVPSYATRLLRLTVLAPDIAAAILQGEQPVGLTARKLMDDTRLPLDWSEQRRALGFV
jgi:DNA invertase Pin-like site-specific DNA recombinase